MSKSIIDEINDLKKSVLELRSHFDSTGYTVKNIVTSEISQKFKTLPQSTTHFGLFTALCVDTNDPWKQNRVRFFSPMFHNPGTPVGSLDFASAISSMGGFDDCGLNWIPPVGSKLCILFENGHRSSAFYVGTTWYRNAGPQGQHNWNFPIEEYYDIHEGHRKGYLLGANDGSQVLPQWNTESYNGIDLNSQADFDSEPDAQKRKNTYPNIYGFKTPQKHMWKGTDGDYKCQHKNKRLEILSSCGNWMLFKDDHLREFSPMGVDEDCTTTPPPNCENKLGGSAYFKHQNELRPWNGPGTPQNNKCTLKQSGIQFLSISGHSMYMDDSVEQPQGIPEWERSTQPFDFGCTDKFTGKMGLVSATGHRLEMDDTESDTNIRSSTNGIRMVSACGHRFQMIDHSSDKEIAGTSRAITLMSTSQHVLELYDGQDLPEGSPRVEGGAPTNKAKNAYIALRSGYGLEIVMEDSASQQNTQQQSITILSPQIDNKERGPHIMRFQEVPSGPGQIFLRAGGTYICYSYDAHFTIVGDEHKNPADKLTYVTQNNFVDTKEMYLNMAQLHYFDAKRLIILGAGQDCPIPGSKEKGPCLGPVLILTPKGVVASDRVIGSASPDAPCISIFQLLPFISCEPPAPSKGS